MRKRLRKFLPTPEAIFQYRVFRWMEPVLGHPRLWHLHRRSVALGIGIGLVTGLIPLPIQMLMAIVIAIVVRANVPAAAAATWATNPFTFIPLYLLAYQFGAWVTGSAAPAAVPPEMVWDWNGIKNALPQLLTWIEAAGHTLLIGLAILSVVLAVGGYVVTMVTWRITVTLAWRNRAKLRRLRDRITHHDT
ncbi:MAG: DUF2062 domain-containing protein [Burkholderiales bacterium]|nr:DUF2062 domain-containing protein [Burkholderiales bacterium]